MMHKGVLKKILYHFLASLVAILILIPFLWMIITSLKEKGALLVVPVQWIPDTISFDAFKRIFTLFPFARASFNSAFVSVATTFVTILSATMAAYVFAKIPFKGRENLFKLYLATMMVPGQVTIIPIFLVLKDIGLVNSFAGLIAPSIFNAFAIFMLRQQIKTIPDDYIDAAVIDGASHIHIFKNVIIPLSKATLSTLTVITFMGVWNDYFWPLVILSDKKKMTLPLALSQLSGQYSSQYNVLMAGSLLSMLPIIIVYTLMQKNFKTGLQLGGIKG